MFAVGLGIPAAIGEVVPAMSTDFRIAGDVTVGVPSSASETVAFAADQLAYYLAVITGARCRTGEGPGDFDLRVDGAGLAPGAFGLRVAPDRVVITGADDLALLHGVYYLLEAGCGCRWLAEFEGGEVIPRNTDLALAPCDETHAPVFSHRAFSNFPDIDERTVRMVDWMCKNRFSRFMVFANMEGSFERYREVLKPHLALRGMSVEMGHHSFRYWLPPAEFFNRHPEWYAVVGGRRIPDGQLCTSNPQVARTVAERICAFLADNPEVDMVGLWPNDGYGWCECEECLAQERQRRALLYPQHPARTDTYMSFVTGVAERVAQAHPDRRLSALAYVNYVEPPRDPVPPNVAVCFAPMHHCFKHPLNAPRACIKDNARYAKLFKRWREKVPGALYLFCYLMLIDTCSLPYPITGTLKENFAWLAEHGCDGYVMEFKPEEWGPFGVNGHVIGRLSWDIAMDVEAWLDDYHHDLYGPAAEEMSAFRRRYFDDFIAPGPCVYHYDLTYTRRATSELLRPCLDHLGRARAIAATGDKRHAEAVERARISIELLLRIGHWQRACAWAQKGDELTRAITVPHARSLGDRLIEWTQAHAHSNALSPPRIAVMVARQAAALRPD